MGLEVMAVDGNPRAPGLTLAHHALNISTLDEPSVLRAAKDWHPDGVMTVGSDRAVQVVANIARALGLAGLDPDAAARTNSKSEMRRHFRANGVPAPRFMAVRNVRQALEAAGELGWPVVIKPEDNAAQRGVRQVDHGKDVKAAYAEARQFSTSGTLLVEERVDGPEITVSSFSLSSRMYPVLIADRFTNPPPYLGIALAHVFPSAWAHADREQVVAITAHALEALGIDDGPGYTQLRVSKDGPKVMEVGARLGGGRESQLIVALGGPDWIKTQIKLALGDPLSPADFVLPDTKRAEAGLVKFVFAPAGQVVEVTGVEEARRQPGVECIVLRSAPGMQIPPRVNAEARQGYLIVLGATREQALTRADAATSHIRIEVRPL
jgi:biotin carboxylase